MYLIKSAADLEKLDHNNPYHPLIKQLLQRIIQSNVGAFDPDIEGYVILIEREDVDRPLAILQPPQKLQKIKWAGVTLENRAFHAVKINNNSFALSFIIPDAAWVKGELRQVLEDNIDP